jgi:adenylate cyclase
VREINLGIVDPIISLHYGRLVKRTGDGVLVEFRSVVQAVRCAIALQNAMHERNDSIDDAYRIEYRVGVHLGDVIEEGDGDLMGDGVNIAARLEALAAPGAICMSEDAYRQVRSRLDVEISDLGEHELKNIVDPLRVYAVYSGTMPPQECGT